jgi:hypothetical protein
MKTREREAQRNSEEERQKQRILINKEKTEESAALHTSVCFECHVVCTAVASHLVQTAEHGAESREAFNCLTALRRSTVM